MSVVTDSINNAVKLSKIGFPEFTTKLVTDVFNAVVSSNLSQTEAYLDMIKQTSKNLTDFVKDNIDDISGTDILNFLCKVAPDINSTAGTYITWYNNNLLTEQQALDINTAVSIPNTIFSGNVANTTTPIEDLYDSILEAVAARIAADKYNLIQETVKLGLTRLIVKGGEIETKLVFETLEIPFYENQSSSYVTDSNLDEVNANSLLSNWINYSSSSKYSRVGVSTVNDTNRSLGATSTQIAGSIKLVFGADYKILVN